MFSLINRSIRCEKNQILKKISFYLKLRHIKSLDDNKRFSDIFHHIFTNTKPFSSVSVVLSVLAHAKKSSCWINRKSHFISYRNYHQCSRRCCISPNLNKEFKRSISIEANKMVWISDLDNYQVTSLKVRKIRKKISRLEK